MDQLSQTFSALADPTRRKILAKLAKGPMKAGDIARPFSISQPAVSRHLKVLGDAGLIERSIVGQWRICRISPLPLAKAAGWLEQYLPLWEESLDRLDSYLEDMQKPLGGKNGKH